MTTFRVWAPRAESVDVELTGERRPMQRRERGWWTLAAPDILPGSDYAFVLDGGRPLPDPRSPWQPNGVHSASRLFDHEAFPWEDQKWKPAPLESAIIYELHIGTFSPSGTFRGAIGRLDYLKKLGVTHIELMPVVEFPGRWGWGYDGVDLYAPNHNYGGPDGFKRFVNACHKKGLAVILDVVYNHLGPDGNYLGLFGPYFTDRYRTPWGEAVNLDGPDSDIVRRFFIDNALMWFRDYHVDGLRLDAIHALTDKTATHFLQELAAEVDSLEEALGRRLLLIAESDLNDPRVIRPLAAGGLGMDAQWSDDFHHALHTVLTGEQRGYYQDFGGLARLAKALRQGYVYDGQYSSFRRRHHGAPPTRLPASDHAGLLSGRRFLGYLQNHDQIGNRARGERISHLVGSELLKIGAALVLTAPFVPLIFQGEEWGASSPFLYFTDHQNPELGQAVREGRRQEFAPFGWAPEEVPDPQAEETFRRSKLDWDEWVKDQHGNLIGWYRRLIRLRRSHPALRAGRLEEVQVNFDEEAHWLRLQRGPLLVACNFANTPQQLPLPPSEAYEVLLASDDAELVGGSVLVPGPGVAIVESSKRMQE